MIDNENFDEAEATAGSERAAGRRGRLPGGLTLRAMTPNAITTAALCSGLTGIRFAVTAASGSDPAQVADDWRKAVAAVIIAGLLDGLDGRIARLLKAQSRFGAELDSLADNVSFGVAPALILFLWSLQEVPRLGWFAALSVAIACALRLARFNARIDLEEQPHKSAGFLTGVPAPVGAGLAFLPLYLWIATDNPLFREPLLVGPWLVLIAFLMISNVATLSWTSIRPRRNVRLELMALTGLVIAALLTEPWWTLSAICVVYLAMVPVGMLRYAKVRRQRATAG
ncbi:MAG: phosphatidylcholine/phosphatidylserine synthase [Novosphingobium sp.]|nr:phosphatidylcholine/phosphatidylserine synthase [Novosphingobium sp.]